MSSESYHEPYEQLSPLTRELHRALASIIEELQAVDWYQQRVDITSDKALAEILYHNRNEEVEHASMILEWIRRHDPVFDANLRTYLFTDPTPITQIEAIAEKKPGEPT